MNRSGGLFGVSIIIVLLVALGFSMYLYTQFEELEDLQDEVVREGCVCKHNSFMVLPLMVGKVVVPITHSYCIDWECLP